MSKLNQPKLNKMLKKEKELWVTKRDGDLYIISPTYVIRTREKIKGGLLTTLAKTFGRLPDEGEVLKIDRNLDIDMALETVYEKTKDDRDNIELVDTKLLEEYNNWDGNYTMKLLANKKENVYIKIDNDKVFIDNPISFKGNNPLSPIYIEGAQSDMVLFPIRSDDNDFLKRL